VVWVGFVLLAAAGVAPFLSGDLDATVAMWLDAWRTCGAAEVFAHVSDLARPVGLAALGLVLMRRLWTQRTRGLAHVAGVLAALGAGTLFLEAAKVAIERPRPGAEYLREAGNSLPSGHVGNVILLGFAALALWPVRPTARNSAGRWLALGALVSLVATARVYEGRHWLSDVTATAAAMTGYSLLAFSHPDPRWRAGASLTAFVAAGLLYGAAATGWRLGLPGGAASLVQAPIHYLRFGQAHEEGRLRGNWSPDGPDPFRKSAWLREPMGRLTLDSSNAGAVEELRLVGRPHPGGANATCRRLGVTLNDEPLGERLLVFGWRAYRFPIEPGHFRAAENVLTLQVLSDQPDGRRPDAPLAAFSELSLHGREPGSRRRSPSR
jgi:membrane-associated phospholipid phosphatase